ncbi:MAG: hypothetical protein H6735_26070 [Alphaproteobacteria bacterium]|nr:hypothetical protein [Alphaproteobacteria bacterium]
MRSWAWLALVAGCSGGDDTTPTEVEDVGEGLLGTGWANPFPTAALVTDGHLDLRDLPTTGDAPIPVERLAWREGFSPAQVSVMRLDGVDDSRFPRASAIAPGEGSVRMVDLTAGAYVPCMAELDAYPEALERATLVRPLHALPYGHRIAVVVTTDAVARPDRFDAMLSDRPPPSLAEQAPHWKSLMADLEAFGIPSDEIAVAWDFPVADGTLPLRAALDQVAPPGGHAFTTVRSAADGDRVVGRTWRAAVGTYRVQDFLVGDRSLQLDADGRPSVVGETDAYLYVHVPDSVKDAPAGSVPVMVFGHGIFSEPEAYLDEPDDPSGVVQLADELGVIVVATMWRGLCAPDRMVPITVAGDFSQISELTDMLVQGQVNVRTLLEEVRSGDLVDDPVFTGASGQALVDRGHVVYYGISLGGIEGAVLLAQDPPVDAGALHVGGSMWSTMLERSSDWLAFEILMRVSVPDPSDRQVLYALSQLWWDPVDPIAWTPELSTTPFLLQESIGDEQVANLTTEALARSVGLPLLAPEVRVPWEMATEVGPLPGRALVQFDPEVPLPTEANRPADVTGAHEAPRTWDGTRAQVVDYLTEATSRLVVHHCDEAACSASNQGHTSP